MGLVTLWLTMPPQVATAEAERVESSTTSVPPVRVLLRTANQDGFEIRVDGPYRVVPPDDWRTLAQGETLDTSKVIATAEGIQIGGREFPLHRIVVEPIESGKLWLEDRRYRGSLLLVRRDDKRVNPINVLPLDDYLASVINGEMPGDFPLAAREAQIIAARTYTLYQMKTFGSGRDFDVYDSARSQMYRGVEFEDQAGRRMLAETPASRRLVDDTQGVVLLYGGRVFCSYYSAVCGGHSLDGRQVFRDATPPLLGVACEDCREAFNYRWERVVDRANFHTEVNKYLSEQGQNVGRVLSVEVTDETPGSLPKVTITGEKGSLEIDTETLRRIAFQSESLPSPMFTIEVHGEQVKLLGHGWGHGVGLCQWGARHQAQAGHTAAEILQHYYPNTTLGWVH